jgi:proline racemase
MAPFPVMEPVRTVDYHTAGEPFRIVVGGVPPLQGDSVLERRRWARAHLDHVRRLLVNEPRGHADMYGCFVTGSEAADLGAVFFHNEGYSTACGHGTIALVTWALESGRLPAREGDVAVAVEVPSGRLPCVAAVRGGDVTSVRFRNVPSFVLRRGVEAAGCRVDLAFGGAFYAIAPAPARLDRAGLPVLIERGRAVRDALNRAGAAVHPLEPELSGVYGVVWTDGDRNVTVFADGEVDRSPCGSGTSARLALLDATGELPRGRALRHRGVVGTEFVGRVVGEAEVAGIPAVITEVEGGAHLTGRHEFVLEPEDPLGTGFLLR